MRPAMRRHGLRPVGSEGTADQLDKTVEHLTVDPGIEVGGFGDQCIPPSPGPDVRVLHDSFRINPRCQLTAYPPVDHGKQLRTQPLESSREDGLFGELGQCRARDLGQRSVPVNESPSMVSPYSPANGSPIQPRNVQPENNRGPAFYAHAGEGAAQHALGPFLASPRGQTEFHVNSLAAEHRVS